MPVVGSTNGFWMVLNAANFSMPVRIARSASHPRNTKKAYVKSQLLREQAASTGTAAVVSFLPSTDFFSSVVIANEVKAYKNLPPGNKIFPAGACYFFTCC